MNKFELDELEYQVTGACIEVHQALGPGLLESVYHKCLKWELQIRRIPFLSEHSVKVNYKNNVLDTDLRVDLFIRNTLVVELKSVDSLLPIHDAQVLTYMKLLKAPKGLLINFNSANLVQFGKRSFVNEYYRLIS